MCEFQHQSDTILIRLFQVSAALEILTAVKDNVSISLLAINDQNTGGFYDFRWPWTFVNSVINSTALQSSFCLKEAPQLLQVTSAVSVLRLL